MTCDKDFNPTTKQTHAQVTRGKNDERDGKERMVAL